MTQQNLMEDDALADFLHRKVTLDDVTKLVHVAGGCCQRKIHCGLTQAQ